MILEWLKALMLGIIQGVTEWLPISSTAHMLLFDELFPMQLSDAFKDLFLVVIQLGSILAVVVLFFSKLWPFGKGKDKITKVNTWKLWLKILIACIPAAIIGLLIDDIIDKYVYGNGIIKCSVIAFTLLVYGVLFIVIERKKAGKEDKVKEIKYLTYLDAIKIGCFQMLALIPGTSRSGSTIMGSRLLGISREASAEFSFFLAIPVMFGASGLKLLKFFLKGNTLTPVELAILLFGMVIAFVISLVCIKVLMRFVKRHSFEVFGWYRIGLAILLLIYMLIAYV